MAMGIAIANEAALEQFIRRGSDAGNQIAGTESRLLYIREAVLRVCYSPFCYLLFAYNVMYASSSLLLYSLYLRKLRLQIHQALVKAVVIHQLIMGSLLSDLASIENYELVCLP